MSDKNNDKGSIHPNTWRKGNKFQVMKVTGRNDSKIRMGENDLSDGHMIDCAA